MSMRTFALTGDGSQLIAITQAGAGTPMTVWPEVLHSWWTCTLADGSPLHVQVAYQQVQQWHQGLPLAEVRPQAR